MKYYSSKDAGCIYPDWYDHKLPQWRERGRFLECLDDADLAMGKNLPANTPRWVKRK